FIAIVAFSTSAPFARAAGEISPIVLACARTGIASVVLFAIAPSATWSGLRRCTRSQYAGFVSAGVVLALHFALFLGGLATTSLPAAVALLSLEPLTVVLAAWWRLGVRPTRLEGVGVILASLGAAVVATGAGEGEHRLLGDALVFAAAVLYALYVTSARHLRD